MEGPNQLFRETVNLDHSTAIPGSVVEKLASHQLEGIRIIHRGLAQNNGFILNDESGLGKTHQVIGYLSAVSTSADKSAIICSSLQRIHHWIYHIELLTKLDFTVAGENIDYANHQIVLTTSENFHHLSKQVAIKLLVIDETKGTKFDTALLKAIANFTTAKKLFLQSNSLIDDLPDFSTRLKICRVQYFAGILRDLIDQILLSKRSPKKAHKLKLFFLTRSVYIRRFKSNYKRDLPLVEKGTFKSNFEAWKLAKGFQIETEAVPTQRFAEFTMDNTEAKKPALEPFDGGEHATEADEDASLNRALIGEEGNEDADAVEAATLVHKESEPLFDFEASTEEMPHLVVESSDSESKVSTCTVPEMPQVLHFIPGSPPRSPATNFEVPETESSSQKTEQQTDSEGYLEFGQALGCCNSESEISADTVIGKADNQPSILEEKYNFPIDRFLRRKSSSSSEAQIVSKESVAKSPAVFVSSSSSNGPTREKSPDLFSDTEDELDETAKNDTIDDTITKLLMKSPVDLDKTVPQPPKFTKSNVSTPISKLIHAQLQTTPGSSTQDASSDDMFADVTVRKAADPNRTDVFEITDNNAFGNQILVHTERACMSPLQQDSESDVQFVSVVRQPDDPIEIVDLDTEVSTPKSQTGRNVHKTPSTAGSGGTPRGWLTKSSRHSSDGGSPRTPTNSKRSTKCRRSDHGSGSGFKRKKLDNWFQDDDDRGADGERASTSVNKRKSAPGGSGGGSRKVSPRKKCFQERVLHRFNQILVSPTGFDSDFE